jgi:hypothetical protein
MGSESTARLNLIKPQHERVVARFGAAHPTRCGRLHRPGSRDGPNR